jgi:beta-mannosidase
MSFHSTHMKKAWLAILACILMLVPLSCKKESSSPNKKILYLAGSSWQFREEGDSAWLPATVPGTVHLDLMNNKLIDDPFYSMNESKIQWVGERNWEYRTTFTIDDSFLIQPHVELVFEGLDTYATVYLNDSLLMRADNMFISWKTECRRCLHSGTNMIRVLFRSAVTAGLEKMKQLPYLLPVSNEQAPADQRSGIFTRKAPFHYGWDWGPRLVTCGIWKPVHLEAWNNARILDLYLKPQFVSDSMTQYLACLEVESDTESSMQWELTIGDMKLPARDASLAPGFNYLETAFNIEKPILWWTNGLGKPYLYNVVCRLLEKGHVVDQAEQKLGIRDLRLMQESDSSGISFFFRLNGVPVFMKGTNYIPPDFFSPRVTREKYEKLLDDAVKANMNMIRVWGGAVYEDEQFYDLCDEKGILVWQDFMFACAMPPGDSLYLDNVRKEAEYQVRRLRHHPCLALWCGNNENLVAWNNWGWKESVPRKTSDKIWKDYEKIFYDLLPMTVLIYDTPAPYWASTPSSIGNTMPDRKSGDEHDWTIWFAQKLFSNYGVNVPRFVSEYGLQSVPQISTIRSFSVEKDPGMNSPDILNRQRSLMGWIRPGFTGNEMILWYIDQYYGRPTSFEETIYLSQLTQALGLKTAIEQHRKDMPRCMGSLYWQLDDCWPTLSWASIDYYGNWKAAHYWVKKAFEKLLLVTDTVENNILVYAISDERQPVEARLAVRLIDFNGNELYRNEHEVVVQPNQSCLLERLDRKEFGKFREAASVLEIRLEKDGETIASSLFCFRLPKSLALLQPAIQFSIDKERNQFLIHLTTNIFAHAVKLQFDSIDGFFSDNFFDMIPGREYTISFTPSGHIKTIDNRQLIITSYYH